MYHLLAVLTFAAFLTLCVLGLRWADRPRDGARWDAATYGDVSRLDALDFEHRPWRVEHLLDDEADWLPPKH